MKNSKIQFICKVGMMGALAAVVMLFEFSVPFVPSFYEMDFSEVIVLLCGFALGPAAGVACEALKILLNLLLNGTSTMGVGEFANFVMGTALTLPATIYYAKHHTKKGAIKGMVIGSLVNVVVCAFMNYFVMLPVYAYFFGLPIDTLVAMGTAVNPYINSLLGLILLAVVPFNIIKDILTALIVTFSYKKVSPILKKQY